MICIHHNDMDGMLAAAIVLLANPDTQLISWTYGQPVPDLGNHELESEIEIIMVDVSFPTDRMVDLALNRKFTWIDHHERAIKDFVVASEGKLYPEYKAHLRVGVGACQLTWEHFFPGVQMPLLVDIVSHYDVFRKEGRYNWSGYVVPVQKGLELVVNNPQDFVVMLQTTNVSYPEQLQSIGNTVLQYQIKQSDRVMKNYFECNISEDIKAVCVNTQLIDNEMAAGYLTTGKYQLLIAFHYDGSMLKWKFSLRSLGAVFNCAEFARLYDGGGHFNAAGFEVGNLELVFSDVLKGKPKTKRKKK
jgi:oligoribonuclease NrnB/cAMP/cGMP phosphodiesterase (DHH superfamily)